MYYSGFGEPSFHHQVMVKVQMETGDKWHPSGICTVTSTV